MLYSPTQMQLRPMIGPGGTQQMLGPGGTQQILGPGGIQPNGQPQQMNLPNGSPFSENTGYPTPPPSPMNVNPMLGPGGTQQLIGPGGTQQFVVGGNQNLLGPGGTQQLQYQQGSQQNGSDPYSQFMQMLYSRFFPANGYQQEGSNSGYSPSVPNTSLPQNLLSMMQDPRVAAQLQSIFGGY